MTQGSEPLVIGLFGGIGGGKSQVSRLFQEVGAVVISGDALGHDALRQPDLRNRIVARWGSGILAQDGTIDRKALGRIVFADDKERQALEAIVHPWIKQRMREDVAQARSKAPLVVVDAAIMLEAGWDDVCSALVFVNTPRAVRLERLQRERGWTESDLDAREKAQLPLTEKARRAHYMVDNSGTVADLRRQVEELLSIWGVTHREGGPETIKP